MCQLYTTFPLPSLCRTDSLPTSTAHARNVMLDWHRAYILGTKEGTRGRLGIYHALRNDCTLRLGPSMTETLTIQQVADHADVSVEALSKDCTDSDLLVFAQLCDDSCPWELMGQYLKLSKDQLNAIGGNTEEKRTAVLQMWKESTLVATYRQLAETFLERKKPRKAVKVCEQFKKSHPTGLLIS